MMLHSTDGLYSLDRRLMFLYRFTASACSGVYSAAPPSPDSSASPFFRPSDESSDLYSEDFDVPFGTRDELFFDSFRLSVIVDKSSKNRSQKFLVKNL
jgi:hypothetical protein